MKQELQQKYAELQMLNQQIQQVHEQFMFLQQQLSELSSLEVSVNDLKNVKKGSEIFSSLGSGIFISSKLENNQKVVVNIGSGVLIEKDLEDAIKLIQSQINNVNSSLEAIKNQLNKAAMYSEKLTQELTELSLKEAN